MADITDFQGEDIIDVRDVIERVEELRSDIETFTESEQAGEEEQAAVEEYKEELAKLEDLLSDMRGYGGDHQWEGNWYPVTLIKESYFEDYMDDMLEDIGSIPKDIPSYLTITVDYDALKQDYSEVDFEGDTYYYR